MQKDAVSSATQSGSWQELFKNVQFVSLFGGNLALFFGFSATILVRSMITWELTHDEMALAYVNLVTAAGILIISLFAGVIVDRVERKKLLIFAHSLILVSELVAFSLYVSGLLTFSLLLIFTISISVSFPFVMPARTTMLVSAVGRSRLARANATMASGVSLARMLSPAIAGFLAGAYGLKYAYLFMVVLYAIALLCVIKLKPNYPEASPRKSFFSELKMGFVYIYHHKPLAVCMMFGILPMLVVIPLQNLLVIFAETVWQAGGSGLGMLMMAMGVGGLFGSVLATQFKARSIAKPVFVATILLAVLLIAFSHAPSFWLGAFVLSCLYACSVLAQTLIHTAIQLMTNDKIRGRVTTISLMGFGLAPIGTLPLAYISRSIGAPWAMTIGSVFILIFASWVWIKVPSFKAIDQAANQAHTEPEPEPFSDHTETIL